MLKKFLTVAAFSVALFSCTAAPAMAAEPSLTLCGTSTEVRESLDENGFEPVFSGISSKDARGYSIFVAPEDGVWVLVTINPNDFTVCVSDYGSNMTVFERGTSL